MRRDSLFDLMMQDYENKLRDLKLESSTEQAQFGYRDPNRVSHLTDEEVSAYHIERHPVKESQVTAEERRKAELFQLTGDFQDRLRTMEEVFDKAGAPDRPGEVGIIDLLRTVMNILRDVQFPCGF